MEEYLIGLAEKTFLALLNPYGSVEKAFPLALRNAAGKKPIRYVGIKNRVQITAGLLKSLEKKNFHLHTLDRQSFGGRAVDIRLQNPVTGRFMTGSSSGTAINVFLGINDLGIGTDGGGSVLAPALSLNLYGFISRLISEEELKVFPGGKSTDGILFQSAVGFMARELTVIREAAEASLSIDAWPKDTSSIRICVQKEAWEECTELHHDKAEVCEFPTFETSRPEQLAFLKEKLKQFDMVIGQEGPIDVYGFGDTVLGHFDENTGKLQAQACKGLIKVANMADATAMVIPGAGFARGYVLIVKSEIEAIQKLFALAAQLPPFQDELTQRYFRDLRKYIPNEFGHTEDV